MINYEIPKASIARLSAAFRTLEAEKERLQIVDYALSQSTLEQVFLKQIRPADTDFQLEEDKRRASRARPLRRRLCWPRPHRTDS